MREKISLADNSLKQEISERIFEIIKWIGRVKEVPDENGDLEVITQIQNVLNQLLLNIFQFFLFLF
jgi:chorismate mutase